MSKTINVNPDHYKLAGRERQGDAVIQNLERRQFAQQEHQTERWRARHEGPQPWEATAAPAAEKAKTRKRGTARARPRGGQNARSRGGRKTGRQRPTAKLPGKTSRPQKRRRGTSRSAARRR